MKITNNLVAYPLAFACVVITSLLGQVYTSRSVRSSWYECIRSSITPPPIVFPIVWTTLYVLIGISLARTIKAQDSISTFLFMLNLTLNVSWCYAFFHQQLPSIAIYHIAVLLVTIVAIMVVAIDKNTKYLLIPYLLWICFATVLNALAIKQEKQCRNLLLP